MIFVVIMKLIWQCLLAPRLYKIYRDGPSDAMYQPQGLEKWGDKVITMANTIMNIGIYTSPFICMYIYKRGLLSMEEVKSLAGFFGSIGCLIMFSILIRGYGRACNPKYVDFIKALKGSKENKTTFMEGIRKYDFEFNAWPVSYTVSSVKGKESWFFSHPFKQCANADLPMYQRVTIQILAYIATHTFGIRLIYPGSLGIVHTLLWIPLFQGRIELVESFEGKRSKLATADGNVIDTMFMDQRKHSAKGKTLVICCEGNSGFYEIGIMTNPIKCGYSSLGWNHPGFAGSTGLPYPLQEQNAIYAVMQYAIEELGFKPQDIVLFGWSIGGYTATWAAVNYPVKALLLDATFDDLLPLAENQMPASWSLLVKEVVRSYVDLNIAELIEKYNGTLRLVRRTEDEIICSRQGYISTNRGNNLLMRLLEHRHPDVVRDLESVPATLIKMVSLLDTQRVAIAHTLSDPEKKIMALISKYMIDYKSTHCVPLPEQLFQTIMDNLKTKSQ